jgi:glycosyltransferase involved in cell wall biosynthesis
MANRSVDSAGLRVALLAFSVRGAMGQYLEALVPDLARQVELHLFVPEHYSGQESFEFIHRFRTGQTRKDALLRFINPFYAWELWKKIRTLQPDLLHIFNGEGYPWSLLLSQWCRCERIPLFLTLHDPEVHPGSFWDYANGIIRKLIVPRVYSVHIHSRVFIQAACRLGARRVVVIPHGSIAERFLRYKRPGVIREPVALFFGRLEAYKGLDLLVEAGLELKGKLRVIIAGPGRVPSKVSAAVQRYPEWFEVRNRFVSDEEAADLFQRASVLVLPYRHATQSSLPLIAAAFDLPVVASSLGAFIEDIPRVGGMLVPPGDARMLAKGMLEAIKLRPVYPYEMNMSNIASRFVQWYNSELDEKI